VIPIAGDLADHGGHEFSYEVQRLGKSSNSSDPDSDSDEKAKDAKQGLRLILKGGVYEDKEQQAVIEFVCDEKRSGLEDEWEAEDRYESSRLPISSASEDEKDSDKDDKTKVSPGSETQLSKEGDPSLEWNSYGRISGSAEYILHMTWKTKYACEKVPEGDGGKDGEKEGDNAPRRHWGFFTWIVLL
jgi:autophagy-related protein 27